MLGNFITFKKLSFYHNIDATLCISYLCFIIIDVFYACTGVYNNSVLQYITEINDNFFSTSYWDTSRYEGIYKTFPGKFD